MKAIASGRSDSTAYFAIKMIWIAQNTALSTVNQSPAFNDPAHPPESR